jgi:uncharacterized protein YndB with AHSA1/START domain
MGTPPPTGRLDTHGATTLMPTTPTHQSDLTVVRRRINAPVDRVFDIMTDAWLYPVWVVGATHIRDVDHGWPAPGAKVHHQVGPWPISISDATAVVECVRPTRLVLQAAAWPVGEARIEFDLSGDDAMTDVRMGEAPTHGIGRFIDNPLQRKLLEWRNRETLKRLACIAEHREA